MRRDGPPGRGLCRGCSGAAPASLHLHQACRVVGSQAMSRDDVSKKQKREQEHAKTATSWHETYDKITRASRILSRFARLHRISPHGPTAVFQVRGEGGRGGSRGAETRSYRVVPGRRHGVVVLARNKQSWYLTSESPPIHNANKPRRKFLPQKEKENKKK